MKNISASYKNLNLVAHIPEGIILSANNFTFIDDKYHYGYNNIFIVNDNIAITFYGMQTYEEKTTRSIIQDFIDKHEEKLDVVNTPRIILKYLSENYKELGIFVYICGYKIVDNVAYPTVYLLDVMNKDYVQVNVHNDMFFYNIHWGGDTDLLDRMFRQVKIEHNGEWDDVEEINLNMNYYSIEEAIEFSKFIMETNLSIQKLTTGQNIDVNAYNILFIKPEGTEWIK